MTQEKILDKLGKIKAHMESAKEIGNEAEAQAFAAMLQTLLLKHKLEMTDIQYSTHLAEEPVDQFPAGGGVVRNDKGKRVYKNYPDVEVRGRRIEWIQTLGSIIARAHSCQIMVSGSSSQLWFVGRKSDVEVADYLFAVMHRAVEKLSWKEYATYYYKVQDEGDVTRARGYRASFITGFIHRLSQRFEEEKRKMYNDPTGTALVRVNKEAIAVADYIARLGGKRTLNALSRNSRTHTDGYRRGQQVANDLNLNANAVKAGKANAQLG